MYFKYTPLHWAAENGHLSVVEYLVTHNADINAIGYRFDFFTCYQTPLHLAIRYNHIYFVDFLINQGANINATDEDLEF